MRLRVMSLNCWGIAYVPVLYSPFRTERMAAVADHLAEADYDVVFLQEVWTESDREDIVRRCRRKLPYNVQFHSGVIGTGTMILCRWPLRKRGFFPFSINGFPQEFWRGDGLTGSGVGLATARAEGKTFAFYTSHYHAEYNREDDVYLSDRCAQAFESAQWITATCSHLDADVLVYAGDFNTETDDLPHRLLTHWAGLDDGRDHTLVPTFSARGNSFTQPGQREIAIDYIMHRAVPGNAVATRTVDLRNPLPNRVPNQHFSYSDHEAVAATIEITPTSEPAGALVWDATSISALEAAHDLLVKDVQITRFRQAMVFIMLTGVAALSFGMCNCGYLVGILWGCILSFLIALCAVTLQHRKNAARELAELIHDEISDFKEIKE